MDLTRPPNHPAAAGVSSPQALETSMSADRAKHQKTMLRDKISDPIRREGIKQTDS
jgi:hypothetical protein